MPRTAQAALTDQSNTQARWADAPLHPVCLPSIRPGFTLARSAKVMTFGSCFARNVEDALARLGCDVPMMSFSVPQAEFSGAPAQHLLNLYTPASILQAVQWAAKIYERDDTPQETDSLPFLYEVARGCVDNNLAESNGGGVPVSRERFFERRAEIYAVLRQTFSADLVTITPGLTEAWFDTERGLYIQEPPWRRDMRAYQETVDFRRLDFAACKAALAEAIALIRRLNPSVRIILTTSPVPLGRTFSGDDVIVANTQAKATLRAVCGELSGEGADYFPSYEMVMLTRDWSVFEPDRLHVDHGFVQTIAGRLVEAYFPA